MWENKKKRERLCVVPVIIKINNKKKQIGGGGTEMFECQVKFLFVAKFWSFFRTLKESEIKILVREKKNATQAQILTERDNYKQGEKNKWK